jgi:hypothetical protein
MKSTTNILPLDEHNCAPNFHEITNNFYFYFFDMGLGVDIVFEHFFIDLN